MKPASLILLALLFATGSLFAQPDPSMPEGDFGIDYNAVDDDGLRTGPWIRVYQNGKMYYKGQFEAGVPVGTFWFWYESGEPMSKVEHINGTAHMEVVNYHKSGFPISKGTYRELITQDTTMKAKDCEWEFFTEEGYLKTREQYEKGKRHGSSITYFDTGDVLRREEYVNDVKEGPWKEFYRSGQLRGSGTYRNGEYHGKFELFQESGRPIVKGEYADGLKDGVWIHFNADGSMHITTKFDKGEELATRRENGEFTDYYDSGIPKATYLYANGVKSGPFTEWYDIGEWVQVPLDEPQPGGGIQYKEQLQGVQVKREGDYLDGELEGSVTYYDLQGRITKTEYYAEGELESTEEK